MAANCSEDFFCGDELDAVFAAIDEGCFTDNHEEDELNKFQCSVCNKAYV